jgi:hypothetical protein
MTGRPPSDDDGGEARRIALPQNIAETLKYLDDLDLEALRVSVENELQRRRLDTESEAKAQAEPDNSSEKAPATSREVKTAKKQGASPLPVGKASLIRASFESGMKPQAIARTLRISVAQVNEVLITKAKGKR